MALLSLVTANQITNAEVFTRQFSGPSGEAITAGYMTRYDQTTGLYMNANASTEADSIGLYGMALETVTAPYAVDVVSYALINGYDLSGMDYGDPVYLSDTAGRLADSAGTIPIIVGMVVAGHGQSLGNAPDKLLLLNVTPGAVAAMQVESGDGFVITSELIAASVDKWVFVADRACRVSSVREIHSVIGGTGATVRPRKIAAATVAAPGAAVAAGIVELTTAAIGLETAVNVSQTGTLSATPADLLLAVGDKIALDFAGTLTGLVGSISIGIDPV